MYQLDTLTKIPEPVPDGVIRIRPGESILLRIDEKRSESSVPQINGRPTEWIDKTIPALIIAISDNVSDIFRVFHAPEDPEDAVPFLAISSDRDALLSCRAEGKILWSKPVDHIPKPSESMQYLHEIIRKTEYCCILCSRTNPAWIQLAGEIAHFAREQNTLTVLALIGKGLPASHENVSDIVGKFHTIIGSSENSNSVSPASLEKIRDLCEATIDDIVASGGRHAVVSDDRFIVRELLFTGGLSYPEWHIAGKPDALELISGYVESIHGNNQTLIGGTYSILKIPWESTIDAATELRNSLIGILFERVPSMHPHQMRLEGFYPEVEGQFDLSIWTFTGNYKLL
ncbi:MAG: hypothetical protein M0Q91_10170 [Methanoregula sp.]|jgi:hypothetical protein|nr:hypothetical protein [Methanoregula sp.]